MVNFLSKRLNMLFARIIRKPRTALALTVVVLMAIALQALSYTELGVASEVRLNSIPVMNNDFSEIPQSVIDNAIKQATRLYESNRGKCNAFAEQLLMMYSDAKDKDCVVLYNSGGWGWSVVDNSPDWQTILSGIGTQLTESGYKPVLLNYQRSVNSLRGNAKELWEMFTGYSAKASDLATRIEFLTENNSRVRVILAGESIGSVICDRVMDRLKDNQRVFSIQTGPPFWYKSLKMERELILTDNGVIPDSFSSGDFITVARANLRTWFGMVNPDSNSGTILLRFQAPGHRYSWLYPEVRTRIEDFLNKNLAFQ